MNYFMIQIFIFLLHSICASELDLKDDSDVCAEALYNIIYKGVLGPFDNSTTQRDLDMVLYSGIGLNDLGNYDGCQYRTERANYVLVMMAQFGGYISLCLPEECTEKDLEILLHDIPTATPHDQRDQLNWVNPIPYQNKTRVVPQQNGHLPITWVKDRNDDLQNHWNPGRTVFTLIFFTILTICIIATTIDVWSVHGRKVLAELRKGKLTSQKERLINFSATSSIEMRSDESPPDEEVAEQPKYFESTFAGKLLLCFSWYTNFQKLFSSRSGSSADPLESLNAVRVMSMGWVIFGHVAIHVMGQPQQNPANLIHLLDQPAMAFVYGAYYAVDAFFWLSGLLMAFLFVKELKARDGKVNWLLLYFHRFWRILPIYMFTLFLIWSYQRYIGDGPLFWNIDTGNDDCKDYWWTNMLFLNNFIPDGKLSSCMGWSWYLANDMQFFIISPPILWLYHKVSKFLGWFLIFGLIICHILCCAFISRHYNFNVVSLDPGNSPNFAWYYYGKPYCRVGPYAVGIGVGLILFAFRHWKATGEVYDPFALSIANSLFKSRIVRYIGLIIGVFLVTFCVFIQFSAYKDTKNGWDAWTNEENWTFFAIDRICISTGLSLVFLPILFGQFSIISEFLCSNLWTPLARLNFSCYLMHYALLGIYYHNKHTAVHFDMWNTWSDFLCLTVCSYATALVVCLMVESPSMGLEKLLLRRGPPPQAKAE